MTGRRDGSTRLERVGLALVRPRAALALAGDRRHAGRSGSDLLVVLAVLVLATQLRGLVAAGWLGIAVAPGLGVRAFVQVLTDTLTVNLGFLVVGAAIVWAGTGTRRDLGRSFDLACVAVLPLVFVDLAASTVVFALRIAVSPLLMWILTGIAYAWTVGLVGLAVVVARGNRTQTDPEDSIPKARVHEGGQQVALPSGPASAANAARDGARRAGWGLAALALAGVTVQAVWLARNVDHVRPMTPGDRAPAFALPRIGPGGVLGEPVALSGHAGKVVIVDFWATWCGPCIKALPHLEALARRHPEVVVIAINIDDPAEARAMFDERGYTIPLLADDRRTSERYGVTSVPHTVVIDRDGIVRTVLRGAIHELDATIAALGQ
jgi:thiol-disulfide isomerase/thioredoxin